jgi:antitoxin HicB
MTQQQAIEDFDPRHIGSSFQDWLDEEGIAEEVYKAAVKELFIEQLLKGMKAKKVTKAALATSLRTSRNQIGRILDSGCDAVTLGTIKRAAEAVGMSVKIELVEA